MTPEEVRELLLTQRTKRDVQKSVGPSEIGGCRRKVWHRLEGTPVTNPGTLRLASSLGTAIHAWIEGVLGDNPRFLLETRVERGGIVGHIDCFDLERNEVVDWKTTKISNIPYFPSKQQRWQVQVYGWLMSSLRPVESVCLVAVPRDGTDREIVTHTEPYRKSVALEALEWLEDLRKEVRAPKPEKRKGFCKDYCPYYDPTEIIGCPGLPR